MTGQLDAIEPIETEQWAIQLPTGLLLTDPDVYNVGDTSSRPDHTADGQSAAVWISATAAGDFLDRISELAKALGFVGYEPILVRRTKSVQYTAFAQPGAAS